MFFKCTFWVGRDGLVGIATRYGLEGPGIQFRWGRDFQYPSSPALEPTQPPIQWIPCLYPGLKRLGRGVDHPSLSTAEVEERVKLYVCSPSGPSWPVIGWPLPLPLPLSVRIVMLWNIMSSYFRGLISKFSNCSDSSKCLKTQARNAPRNIRQFHIGRYVHCGNAVLQFV
jgi:hypothetical protein